MRGFAFLHVNLPGRNPMPVLVRTKPLDEEEIGKRGKKEIRQDGKQRPATAKNGRAEYGNLFVLLERNA